MRAFGLDLSLTSSGVATAGWTKAIRPGKLTGYPRLRYIRAQILDMVIEAEPDLYIIEGPTYGQSGQKGHHERGGLWWMITEVLDESQVPLVVAPPASIKLYATGVGNADKDRMLMAAARNYPWFAGGNDEADALWACAMAHDWAGEPISEMPARNREALDKIQWPVLLTVSRSTTENPS